MTRGALDGPATLLALELHHLELGLSPSEAAALARHLLNLLVDAPGVTRLLAIEAIERDSWHP